jgi:hypothetical protein
METVEASLVATDDTYCIQLDGNPPIAIPVSEDNPKNVKLAFSALIRRLKSGPFVLKLKETEGDLFFHVAKEYIEQLNRELAEVYSAMKKHGFVDENHDQSEG